jgi:hypothetical protein
MKLESTITRESSMSLLRGPLLGKDSHFQSRLDKGLILSSRWPRPNWS